MSCSSGLFDPNKYPTPINTNNSFSKAAIAQEMMREAQVYNDGHIFSGVKEKCTKGYAGIKNCCTTSPQAQSNSQVMSTAIGVAGSAVKYAGEKAIDMASSYMYDAMFTNGWTDSMASNMMSNGTVGTNLASNGLSVGAWGFTYSTGTFTAGSGLMGANTQLMSFGSNGYLSFNPYVFGAMVAMAVIQNLRSCTQDEIMLSMHRGARLSYFIDETCSNKVLGTCMEWQDNYCSFNSVLSKIINTQGKPQLGLDLSDCGGLTVEQLNKIDFTKINFSEFTQDVVEKATSNLPTNINGNYTPAMQSTPQGSSQTLHSPVIPSYN